MKNTTTTIENKITSIVPDAKNECIKYSDLIKLIVNAPPVNGMTISEMKTRMEIIAHCDDGNFVFKEEHIKVIKDSCAAQRWTIINKDLIDFVDYIEGL